VAQEFVAEADVVVRPLDEPGMSATRSVSHASGKEIVPMTGFSVVKG